MAATTTPRGGAKSGGLLLAGVVGVAGGILLLGYGLAPAKDLWEAVGPAFSGSPPPADMSERMDAAMAELKGRALIDGVGFVALMVGIILVGQGLAKPKPRPVEELVKEELERRLAAQPAPAHGAQTMMPPVASPGRMQASGGGQQAMTASVPPPSPSASTPVPPSPRRTHCPACGSILVAAGRICPQGHAQA